MLCIYIRLIDDRRRSRSLGSRVTYIMSNFFAPSPRGLGLYVADTAEKDRLALMKRKKKDFDYMTSSVLMEHQKHLLASLHFKVGFIV